MATPVRFKNNRSMLVYFLRGSKRYFLASAVFAAVLGAVELVNPRIVGFVVDSVIGDEVPVLPAVLEQALTRAGGIAFLRANMVLLAIVVLCAAVLDFTSRMLFRMGNQRGAETLMKTMRDDLYAHIIRLPYAWHNAHATGDLIQRCTSDVETIKQFFSEQMIMLFRSVVFIALATVFLFRICVPLAWIATLFVPVIVVNSLLFHGGIAKLFLEVDTEEGKLSTITQENLTGVRVVRAFGRESYERERFEKQNEVYQAADMRLSKRFCVYWSTGSVLSNTQRLAVVLAGAVFCVQGALSVGSYIAFVGINAIMTWPVRMLGRMISEMSKAGVSIERIREIMNAEEEKDADAAKTPQMDGDIVFDRVTFAFDEGAPVLKDVSFTIEGGKTTGILGATGSGKSTVAYLLDRLYELGPENGSITVSGVDIRQIPRTFLRTHIGMVLQEPYLFSRTIEENISIAAYEKSKEETRRVAKIASLTDTIDSFPDGYDTFVGERGVTLSGGEKQRTAIAQMLVRKPEIMVFDDSLSAVDAETDATIRAALRNETKGATVVLIAHRLSTLMHADHILVLDKGRVAEEGTHAELLAKGGIYKKVYDLQTQGAE